mmetsp:Transcript_17804/g.40793  ORF Transcript_17804/g.40793 Transcript_17804/m.40793 type:complete len:227 (-) Transcript_17804:331-1011(-)
MTVAPPPRPSRCHTERGSPRGATGKPQSPLGPAPPRPSELAKAWSYPKSCWLKQSHVPSFASHRPWFEHTSFSLVAFWEQYRPPLPRSHAPSVHTQSWGRLQLPFTALPGLEGMRCESTLKGGSRWRFARPRAPARHGSAEAPKSPRKVTLITLAGLLEHACSRLKVTRTAPRNVGRASRARSTSWAVAAAGIWAVASPSSPSAKEPPSWFGNCTPASICGGCELV